MSLTISNKKLIELKKEYNMFKLTKEYNGRKEQIKYFCPIAEEIVNAVIKKNVLSNIYLTALIQMLGYGRKYNTFIKYMKILKLSPKSENVYS